MDAVFIFIIGLYAIFFLVCIVITILKIRERIKEKPKDDSDLNKFDKY
ncbi:MAG: hypothetical protein IJH34_00075 [Romboutsia sp.]|nr:hypothetical protein [Romboutsia sp.]